MSDVLNLEDTKVVKKENKVRLHTGSTDREITLELKRTLGSVVYIPENDEFYIYNGKVWKSEHRKRLQSRALNVLYEIDNGKKANKQKASSIIDHLELTSQIEVDRSINDKRNYLILNNGVLDIGSKSFSLKKHSPIIYNTNLLQVSVGEDDLRNVRCDAYSHLSDAPIFKRFLNDTFSKEYYKEPEETISLVQEMMGYCLTSHTKAQKAFFLKGDGQDGKSVICDVLEGILGKENTTQMNFESFNKEFYVASLIGKNASISRESKRMRFKEDANTGTFKAIVSGDAMQINRKNKETISCKLFSKLIFAVNHYPEVPDNSHGFARRVINIPFKRRVPMEEINENLASDILKSELKQVFLFALQGLYRLQSRGYQFLPSKDIKTATSTYLNIIDPIQDFINKNLVINYSAKIRPDRLQELYLEYMELNNISGTVNEKAIGKVIIEKYGSDNVTKKKTAFDGDVSRKTYYIGIGEKHS